MPRYRRAARLFASLAGVALTAGMIATAAPSAAATVAKPAAAARPAVNKAPSYNGLALTPPMGWNDWSYYQCNIDENLILTQARALVSSGLAAKGYDTVTTDDCWLAPSRDASGNLQADPTKFPDGMAYLGQQLHAMGLKFGIYEDAGTTTCGGYPGSWGHYTQDAEQFAKWGVDYVKLDGCNVPSVAGQSAEQTYQQAYTAFSKALLVTGRPIVFSASAPAYFQGSPQWLDVIGWTSKIANLWREGADIPLGQESGAEKWAGIAYNYSYNVGLARFAGPGHWNDPDFLLVGDSGLSTVEMQSQMTLWAEMAAPLISSTDLTELSQAALAILGNRDIIAVDQDKLGAQGTIVQRGTGYNVLARPLANGDVSVVLFNKGDTAQTITTTAANVGLTSGYPYQLTDLVTKRRYSSAGVIAANVPAHGTVIYRVHRYAATASAPLAVLTLSGKAFRAGHPTPVTVTLADYGTSAVDHATLRLAVPAGWHAQPASQTFGPIKPGRTGTAVFQVTSTAPPPGKITKTLTATATYWWRGERETASGELSVVTNTPFPNLAAAFNNIGITDSTNYAVGNFDGDGNSYSADLLKALDPSVVPGATISAYGATFTWPNVPAGRPDNVAGGGATITFSGRGSMLAFLGANAPDTSDRVTVAYTDHTSTTGQLGFPNWSFAIPGEFGSKVAFYTMGRNTPTGISDTQYAYNVFYNSIPIDPSKTVASVTLPNSPYIHIFAMTIQP